MKFKKMSKQPIADCKNQETSPMAICFMPNVLYKLNSERKFSTMPTTSFKSLGHVL